MYKSFFMNKITNISLFCFFSIKKVAFSLVITKIILLLSTYGGDFTKKKLLSENPYNFWQKIHIID